jgi:triacylglycerol lipase
VLLVWLIAGLAAALVMALGIIGARALLRRRRSAPRPRSGARALGPRHPVILLHGLLGFDQIVLGARKHAYFRGVAERLEAMGARVHTARVPASASIAARAEKLVELVRGLPAPKVNLVAHSMGGLDARYAISRLGLAGRVASLTTIGTPHLGTPLADLGSGVLSLLRIEKVLRPVIDLSAFHDLTTTRMAEFNRTVRDARQVLYASVVARTARDRLNPILWPAHAFLAERAGDSDGLVPAASQRWGEVWREIDADHWAQIGWSSDFDAPALFEELARQLRARGL